MKEFEFIKSHIAEKRCKELEKEEQKELKALIENVAYVRNVFLFIGEDVVKSKLKTQLERDIFSVRRYEHGDIDDLGVSTDFEISLVWDMKEKKFVHNSDCNDALDNLEDILRDSTSMVPNSMIPDMLKATQNIFDVINEIVKNIYKEDKANLIQSYIDTMKLRNASSDTVLPPIESHAFKEMFKRLNEYSYDTYMVIGLGKVQESYVPGMIKKGVTIRGEYKLCYEAIEFANVLCINPRKRTFRCEKHKNKNVIHSTGDISFEDVDTIPDKKLRGFKVKEIIEAMDRLDKILKDLGASNER